MSDVKKYEIRTICAVHYIIDENIRDYIKNGWVIIFMSTSTTSSNIYVTYTLKRYLE